MCCTSGPSRMKNTILYAGEATHPVTGRYIHVQAYQNEAQNLQDGPNAMILPFPAGAPLTRENIVDTRDCPDFLKDMAEAIAPKYLGTRRGMKSLKYSDAADVFESGSYTVVLASSPGQIPEALERVPANKRPAPNLPLYAFYGRAYPGQPIAVCCWDGAIKPEPLLWWYEPAEPGMLFLPALDAHDGQPPRAGPVKVDHTLLFGSKLHDAGTTWAHGFRDIPPAMQGVLPVCVNGTTVKRSMSNGDFFMPVGAIYGRVPPEVQRTAPAAW